MRKIDNQLRIAWENNQTISADNSRIQRLESATLLYLHNNLIAEKHDDGRVLINLCGWNTLTTRRRLCDVVGVDVRQIKGLPTINGKPIPSNAWINVTTGEVASC